MTCSVWMYSIEKVVQCSKEKYEVNFSYLSPAAPVSLCCLGQSDVGGSARFRLGRELPRMAAKMLR